MEDVVKQIAPYVISVLTALTAYLKIHSERSETKSQRDQQNELLEYRVQQCETRLNNTDKILQDIRDILTQIKVSIAHLEKK